MTFTGATHQARIGVPSDGQLAGKRFQFGERRCLPGKNPRQSDAIAFDLSERRMIERRSTALSAETSDGTGVATGRGMQGRLNVALAVIARDQQALHSVIRYLRLAGARLSIVLNLEQAAIVAEGADVAILFADGYPLDQAIEAVTQLSVRLVVVVTSDVSAFRPSLTERARCSRVLVLPQRGFHRTLVEAIRHGLPIAVGDA
jgi:hypothetical protein